MTGTFIHKAIKTNFDITIIAKYVDYKNCYRKYNTT